MSEKKRSRRRKDEYTSPGDHEVEKPTKIEYQIAKWMKKNVKTKKTKFLSHNVEYFTSSKALDALMKSKFGQGDEPILPTREHAIEILDIMLEHKFFHRAKKVPVTIEEIRGGAAKSSKKEDDKEKEKEKKSAKQQKKKDEKRDTEAEAEGSASNGADENGGAADVDKVEKRKRKIRLDMHPEQLFVDGSEAYVWIYDPIPIHYWIYGLLLLLGAIGLCLFPLWPPMLRKGVYYLSIAAAGFLVFILALTIVRLIIFTIVWALTGGKLHFWIFPNLTEDVGFFASFWPLYESKYVSDAEKKAEKKKSKKKKEKDSDAEEDATADVLPLEPEKIEEVKEHDADMELRHRHLAAAGVDDIAAAAGDEQKQSAEEQAQSKDADTKCSHTPSESESEISSKDYEIISSIEVHSVN